MRGLRWQALLTMCLGLSFNTPLEIRLEACQIVVFSVSSFQYSVGDATYRCVRVLDCIGLDCPFNTPLEMPGALPEYVPLQQHNSFNTPLEMLSWTAAKGTATDSGSLSILRWRCRVPAGALSGGWHWAFQYSVGDARPLNMASIRCSTSLTFNTPLEMQKHSRRSQKYMQRYSALSILRWRCSINTATTTTMLSQDLSILRWRCFG